VFLRGERKVLIPWGPRLFSNETRVKSDLKITTDILDTTLLLKEAW
jgi:hypothetical protein